jgi:F-type H+-transporting ATPase subunit delta
MFKADRWALAFTDTLGAASKDGLTFLHALVAAGHRIHGSLIGTKAARQFEEMADKAALAAELGPESKIVAHFAGMLIQKRHFDQAREVINAIQELLDRQNHVVKARLDTVRPIPEATVQKLITAIRTAAKAGEVRLDSQTVPALIGGYRLRIGDESIDCSIQRQLRDMSAYLIEGKDNGKLQ